MCKLLDLRDDNLFNPYNSAPKFFLRFPFLKKQITRRDEGMAPFISGEKRNYVFGGICGTAASASIKVHSTSFFIYCNGIYKIFGTSIKISNILYLNPVSNT